MAIPAPYDRHPLMLAPVMQMVLAIPDSVLWVVGDTWVRCERGAYFIGADEKVSWEKVYELLLGAQGDAYPWDEY
ncbi:hypothetical protein [Pseudomonas mosselii]|uniref:hypothetical protein n=1 Tax=Pseudomonas mosselii TaxID=78327 RepID=UPI0021DAD566|nr:hypothetical protein [Pseudomonas mosselii]MCU9527539.1 hypothetical protein [Pseudomonas mosselii]MCU9534852.1 hypothetical protein [Pseudomonas mosselii]MCU9542786.1 hypothetical protein [Pseudomonas mosselii]MCU9546692.1 hypothetical protein [Pseudomonas mosselii]